MKTEDTDLQVVSVPFVSFRELRGSAVRVLLYALGVVVFAGSPAAADNLLLDRFRDYLESLRVQSGIPGLAAAIIGTSDIVWERGFGQQDIERSIATRPDTPFQLDGVTQLFTASLVLRCVEEGRLSLEDRVGQFRPDAVDPTATLRQVLSHTSGTPENPSFTYRPERYDVLGSAVSTCAATSFTEAVANLLDRLAMRDSLPGADVVKLTPATDDGFPTPGALQRYASVLDRLAIPYVVASKTLRASRSNYAATTLTASAGLISTVQNFAQFDLALKNGLLLRADTLAHAWQVPVRNGQRLPHALGWFVQTYNGEPVAWQFGVSDPASSSMVIELPGRGLTLVLLANSSDLVKPYALAAGDVTVSPFARLFLQLVVR